MPHFPAELGVGLTNAKSGETYRLVRADQVPPVPERLTEITSICNEPLVYETLFREPLAGAAYTPERAGLFLSWAASGWRAATHFVFFALRDGGGIAAAADIKSPEISAAEIGYWASGAHKGIGAPLVAALCEVARAAGYASIYARVRAGNVRSQSVLIRNSFSSDALRASPTHLAFCRRL